MTNSDHDKWRHIPVAAKESRWHAADGWELRRIDWKPKTSGKPRGSILFLPGRGDHYEKYLETLDHWADLGWQVTSIDWRGQGDSGRLLADRHVGHIDDFSTWIADLRHFNELWQKDAPRPHVVIGHSMGGHLTMRGLIEKAIQPDAAVLSAPMLGIQTGGMPLAFSHGLARFMEKIGRGEKPAWKVSEKPLSGTKMRQKLLTNDPRRYVDELSWWEIRPEVKLGPPSWHWMERAISSIREMHKEGKIESVDVPVLVLATKLDQLVNTRQVVRDANHMPRGELVLFRKKAAHELLREADSVRDKCLCEIDDFLARHAPAQ